jgi:hypothetical protein
MYILLLFRLLFSLPVHPVHPLLFLTIVCRQILASQQKKRRRLCKIAAAAAAADDDDYPIECWVSLVGLGNTVWSRASALCRRQKRVVESWSRDS